MVAHYSEMCFKSFVFGEGTGTAGERSLCYIQRTSHILTNLIFTSRQFLSSDLVSELRSLKLRVFPNIAELGFKLMYISCMSVTLTVTFFFFPSVTYLTMHQLRECETLRRRKENYKKRAAITLHLSQVSLSKFRAA